jgi:hypothetical protein
MSGSFDPGDAIRRSGAYRRAAGPESSGSGEQRSFMSAIADKLASITTPDPVERR